MLALVLTMTACGNAAAPEPPAGVAPSRPVVGIGGTGLEVRVVDPHGKPVVGAEVLLSVEGNGNGDGLRAITDDVGIVRFRDIAAGGSVGVWVAHGGVNIGFAQVGVQTGRDNTHSVIVRGPTATPSSG
jgi:uncharacterized GH25 family protein